MTSESRIGRVEPRMEIIARVIEPTGQLREMLVVSAPTDGTLSVDEVVNEVTGQIRRFADDLDLASLLRDGGRRSNDDSR